MQPQPQSNDNWLNRSRDFQTLTKSFEKEIMETFVYMGLLSLAWETFVYMFSKFLLVSNLTSLCGLEVQPLECQKIEKWMNGSRKRLP